MLNGKAKSVIRNGVAITYEDVLKKYLRYLIKRTKESVEESGLDSNVDCIAITVPSARSEYGESSAAEYSDIIKRTIHEITGLDEKLIVVLPEPTAAAYSYLADDKNGFEGNQTFMIFDLGGGTADVAVVNHDSITGSSKVLADRGVQKGAHLWNNELAKILRTNLPGISISEDDTDVEKLKRDLTRSDEAWFARDKAKCKVQRSLFDQNTSDLREELMHMVDKVMDDAEIDHFESIDKLVLVGGGSNMPQIKEEFIARYQGLNEDKIVMYRPSVAISNGAALYAKEQVVDTASPRKGKKFIRKASHSYGLDVYRDDDSKYSEVLNLIFKGKEYENGRIYKESSFVIYPDKDNAEALLIKIFESDATENDCDMYGFLRNRNGVSAIPLRFAIPASYIGHSTKYQPTVAITLDSDGRVKVTLKDSKSNHESSQLASFEGRDS